MYPVILESLMMQRKTLVLKGLVLVLLAAVLILPMVAGEFSLAQSPTPTPAPTATPPFVDRHEDTFVKTALGFIVEIAKYLITAALGAIGFYIFKPRLDHWVERRKLKLQARDKKRQRQQQTARRRKVDDKRLQAYLDRVADLYNTTRIFVQKEAIPLEEIYTDVYVLDRPQAFRRFDITKLKADPGVLDRAERVPGLGILEQPNAQRLFILGKPGGGKTTFLRYLARQAATGIIDKVPIFVTLHEWADSGLDLLPFIVQQFKLCNFPDAGPYVEHLLEDIDDALVLFDGLDEIRQEGDRRTHAVAALRNFGRRYERAQVLVTCRVAASDYSFEGFAYVEIANFTDKQIDTFVGKYFRGNAKTRDAFLQDLGKSEHRGLRELARTPLLLGLLCLSFEETLTFPRHRDEIYTEALDALLKKWDARRGVFRDEIYHGLSLKHKRGLLACLAYETFGPGDYFFPQRDLEARIIAYLQNLPHTDVDPNLDTDVHGEAALKAIEAQHGILVERAHRIYAFAHLTFQEYYTARYVIENVTGDTVSHLLSHAADDRWREVILLTAAMLGNTDAFFDHFLHALDSLVWDDENLIALLAWAARKASTVKSDYKTAAIRSYYCDRAIDRALDSERALDFDFAINLDFDRNLARALTLALALDRDLDRTLAHALAHALDRALDFDLALALALSQQLGLDALHQALSALNLPPQNAPTEAWNAFASDLQAIMIEHRAIGYDWHFGKEQARCLERYFYTAELLVQCLNLAIVTDRGAIEDRLLLPPGHNE